MRQLTESLNLFRKDPFEQNRVHTERGENSATTFLGGGGGKRTHTVAFAWFQEHNAAGLFV